MLTTECANRNTPSIVISSVKYKNPPYKGKTCQVLKQTKLNTVPVTTLGLKTVHLL